MSGFSLMEDGTDISPEMGSYFFFNSQKILGGMRDYEPNIHVYSLGQMFNRYIHVRKSVCQNLSKINRSTPYIFFIAFCVHGAVKSRSSGDV